MPSFVPRALLAVLLATAVGCSGGPEGRFEGTGAHARPVTTSSPQAQVFFNQGLHFLYAFNHDEAIRSFERGAQLDPNCAMMPWGIALAHGPHINNPALPEDRGKEAWKALTRARELAPKAAPVERDLIEALGKRYANPPPADRAALDQAYAEAMRAVRKKHPGDADVGALTAEALMDLHPWDLYDQKGTPHAWTGEIVHLLEEVIAQSASHPLALHLYIHAVEASTNPGKAVPAADRLRDLTPGLGHLVHMPSHIDVRVGTWEKGVRANVRAITADDDYVERSKPPGFYRIYMAHNRHMLAFVCMMRGQSAMATRAGRELIQRMPEDWLKEFAPIVDGFLATPYELQIRFGQWNEMLAEPEPREIFPIARTLRHYARGVAFAALKRPGDARAEQKAFLEARTKVPKEATFGNNAAADLLAVAEAALEGEILYREGKKDAAFASLREAVRREDALRYSEPPDWIQPIRHTLGAALMDSGRAGEAEAVYREDLKTWPENGWSLLGMTQSLRAQGKDAAEFDRRFREVWKDADLKTTSSCLCLPAAK
jgi:tetratricopeptide (TPR) repeat protein